MWLFIILMICAFFLFFFAIRAGNRRGDIQQKKQGDISNNSNLLSDQIDERLGIKKRGKFDSKTDRNRNKKIRKNPLSSCGTRFAVDPVGRNGNNTYASQSVINGVCPNSSGFMTRKQLRYYFSHIDGELFTDYLLAESDDTLIKVSNSEFTAMLKRKTDYDKFSKNLSETASNNNKGIAYEKSGDINKAIAMYERNLDIDYPARHSYDRLLILYRKAKDYENEIRVCELAISIFPNEPKYVDRLEKTKKLSEK